MVIDCGGFTVSAVYGTSGFIKRRQYGGSSGDDVELYRPKQVYESFASAEAVADVDCFINKTQPHNLVGASLPWPSRVPTAAEPIVDNLSSPGSNDSLDCRILLERPLRAEQVPSQGNFYPYRVVSGAWSTTA